MNTHTVTKSRFAIQNFFSQWKVLFSTKYLTDDLIAGATVAFVAIPLSLAIALASGVSPGTGLITAIIAGIVCGLFGGTPLAVSGPAAAMSILIAATVEKYGLAGLTLICLLAGGMQLISGIIGLGRFARYVPLPVIAGFTAGIGVIILVGQLPRAFGLQPPAESHIFDVFNHLKEYFHEINGVCLLLVALTIAIIRGLPKVLPKIPPILPAVAITTLIVYGFDLNDIPLIGAIPTSLPVPKIPAWPNVPFGELIVSAFTIFMLASLETLLSSSAIDKLANSKKHDSNQELIGQGLGNIAVSLFGGIPVTGVIARSATNVRAGAKTRRSAIFHSLLILISIFTIAPLISQIPIAALAGVLFSIAFSMINVKEFYGLWKTSRAEAFIYAITFFTIIFVDLISGVQAGIIAACFIVLIKAARAHLMATQAPHDDMFRFAMTGSLTFLSTGRMAQLEEKINQMNPNQTILLDLSSITNMDISSAAAIVELFNLSKEKQVKFYIKGLPTRFETLFKGCGGEKLLEEGYLISEHELRKKECDTKPRSSRGRLIHGIQRFYKERKYNNNRLFEFIKQKQDPHTLFITCSDSRLIPNLITSSDPGELFTVRNVGNYIPPYQLNSVFSEAAALEFALKYFDIGDIVICGHANCGAIQACRNPNALSPKLDAWIQMMRSQLVIDDSMTLNEVARQNVLNQIENIKQYPIVQEKLGDGNLNIHAWFFDFDKSIVYEWDHREMNFKSLIPEYAHS